MRPCFSLPLGSDRSGQFCQNMRKVSGDSVCPSEFRSSRQKRFSAHFCTSQLALSRVRSTTSRTSAATPFCPVLAVLVHFALFSRMPGCFGSEISVQNCSKRSGTIRKFCFRRTPFCRLSRAHFADRERVRARFVSRSRASRESRSHFRFPGYFGSVLAISPGSARTRRLRFCARTHESRRPKNSPARPSKISIFGDPQKSPKSALFGLFEKRSKTRKIPGNPKKFAAERGCSRPLPRAHPRKTEGVEPCARAGTRAGSQRSKSHKTRQVRVSRIPGGARPWRVTRAHTRARAKMACANLGGGRDSPLAGSGWGRVCPKQRENQNLKRP